jgi:hypothetical protein
MPSTIKWSGAHTFRLSAAAVHEDTLRIAVHERKQEKMYRLILPTLCITYADMKFQNAVGGLQKSYPHSIPYGPAHFDPPVTISGAAEIERLTYIRGAARVVIGVKETVVEFPCWNELVIPRLRIDRKTPAEGVLHVPETAIGVSQPLRIDIRQFADGRHIGGVRVEKRHPDWRPPVIKPVYDLWIHVSDGVGGQSLPRTRIDILTADPKQSGGFALSASAFTDGKGNVAKTGRPAGVVEAFVVRSGSHRAVVRCVNALPGQKVRLHIKAWPLENAMRAYLWKAGDTVEYIAGMCGCSASELLELNELTSADALRAGDRVVLPCHPAVYRLEAWDTLDSVAVAFGMKNGRALAKATGGDYAAMARGEAEIRLPRWHYFLAQKGDTLERFEQRFGLPKGSVVSVGRCYHPDARVPIVGETVAVPSKVARKR